MEQIQPTDYLSSILTLSDETLVREMQSEWFDQLCPASAPAKEDTCNRK